MLLQSTCSWTFVVTEFTAKWFVTCVDSFMALQIGWSGAFIITVGAAEWLLACVGSFVQL